MSQAHATASPIEQRGYAQPNALVSTEWVANHLDDASVRIVEGSSTTSLSHRATGGGPAGLSGPDPSGGDRSSKPHSRNSMFVSPISCAVARARAMCAGLKSTAQKLACGLAAPSRFAVRPGPQPSSQ